MEMINAPIELFRRLADFHLPEGLLDRLRYLRDAWGRDELTPDEVRYYEALVDKERRITHFRTEARRLLEGLTGHHDGSPGLSPLPQPGR